MEDEGWVVGGGEGGRVIDGWVDVGRMEGWVDVVRVEGCYHAVLSSSGSELQIALVALFSEMLYRFPNVVVAQVTRESVQQAIANGITAQQVASSSPHEGAMGGCGVGGNTTFGTELNSSDKMFMKSLLPGQI